MRLRVLGTIGSQLNMFYVSRPEHVPHRTRDQHKPFRMEVVYHEGASGIDVAVEAQLIGAGGVYRIHNSLLDWAVRFDGKTRMLGWWLIDLEEENRRRDKALEEALGEGPL